MLTDLSNRTIAEPEPFSHCGDIRFGSRAYSSGSVGGVFGGGTGPPPSV